MTKEAAKSAIGVAQNNSRTAASSLNWEDIRLFGVTARAGSLRKASNLLRLQVPTLSKRIDALEASLGLKLFDRTPQGLVLTAPGRRMAADVESIEMILQGTAWRGHAKEQEIQSEVKLMMSEGLADRWFIPHFLNLFIERHPNVAVRLGTSPESGNTAVPPFDLQIQYAPAAQGTLNTVRVGTFHFMYFASESYINRYGVPKAPDEFANHRLADAMQSLTAQNGIWGTFSNIEAGGASLISNSGLAIANAVQAGAVIGVLPSYIFLTSKIFVPVLPSMHYKTGIYVNYSATAAERPEVRAMLDFLKEVVFDRRRMPWFADGFECPEEEWRAKLRAMLIEHAGVSVH
jgi:DNA-binding transcriptional LysR family regulator